MIGRVLTVLAVAALVVGIGYALSRLPDDRPVKQRYDACMLQDRGTEVCRSVTQ